MLLLDGALAWEIMFKTLSGRSSNSHQEANGAVPTAQAGGGKLFCLPERGGPASGELATGQLKAAETAPRTKVVPPEWDHKKHFVLVFPDDLRNQSNWGIV